MKQKKYEMNYHKYILAICGFDYLLFPSGTSRVVKTHQEMFNSNRISYLVIYPNKKFVNYDKGTRIDFCSYSVVIDGVRIDSYSLYDLYKLLVSLESGGFKLLEIHIHHLLWHNFRRTLKFLELLKKYKMVYFIHDYYLLCNKLELFSSKSISCALDDYSMCNKCKYKKESEKHRKRMIDLFKNFEMEFIIPSLYVKRVLEKHGFPYMENISVVPHLVKENTEKVGIVNKVDDIENSMRISFIGNSSVMKGWNVWKELVSKFENTREYSFYYLGNPPVLDTRNIRVDITQEGNNAMCNAMIKQGINVVVLWSLCAETFSYTLYECVQAKVFIITNSQSGNIAEAVYENNWGIVLKDISELFILFSDFRKLKDMITKWSHEQNNRSDYVDNDYILHRVRNSKITSINKHISNEGIKLYSIKDSIMCNIYRILFCLKR